jgi:molybdenum cofactor cytidylyltransferase
MTAGAVIVAAGFARRFGSDKRLFELEPGQPMLLRTVETYLAVFSRVAVVLRADDLHLSQLIERTLAVPHLQLITTMAAGRGMAHSLADGVRAVEHWRYAFIGLGDMPYVQRDTLRTLDAAMAALDDGGAPRIVQPVHEGTPGHPVGFTQALFREIIALTGDTGARPILERYRAQVLQVPVTDPGITRDIDSPPH